MKAIVPGGLAFALLVLCLLPPTVGVGSPPLSLTRAAGWPAVSTMIFSDNVRGAYADYPYNGTLPDYAPGPPLPPDRPPVAAFTFSPAAPCRTEWMVFDASTASDDVGIVN